MMELFLDPSRISLARMVAQELLGGTWRVARATQLIPPRLLQELLARQLLKPGLARMELSRDRSRLPPATLAVPQGLRATATTQRMPIVEALGLVRVDTQGLALIAVRTEQET